jgi:hypothetical protein
VLVVEVLFAELGSGVADVTVAVLLAVAPELIFTTSPIVAVPPEFIVPRLHVTVVVPVHDPCDVVTDTNDSFPGITSVTVTFEAELGPALLTTIW